MDEELQSRKKYLITKGELIFYYVRDYYLDHENAYETLIRDIPWRERGMSRLSYYMGPANTYYFYSDLKASSWHWIVLDMKDRLERDLGYSFNSCLLNYYPDGNAALESYSNKGCGDKDDVIVTISLGATRDLVLRQNNVKKDIIEISYENDLKYERNSANEIYRVIYPVQAGDLYVMCRNFHAAWAHAFPVRKKIKRGRISLTFRKLYY